MSIDFDSAALQMQHEEEEYDHEDYQREQELHKLLTDLPDDMLEDSRDASSPEPDDCEDHATERRNVWDPQCGWSKVQGVVSTGENGEGNYEQDPYRKDYIYDRGTEPFSRHLDEHHSWDEQQDQGQDYMYDHRGYAYPSMGTEQSTADGEFGQYHHSEQQREDLSYGDQAVSRQHVQAFEPNSSGDNHVDHYKVSYNPYQPKMFSSEVACTDGRFDQLQREFLDSAHSSVDQQKIAQLQVLNKAQRRQLEELEKKLEDSRRSMRYLEHQSAIVKDEKEGLAVSLKESGLLLEEAKEKELQLQAKLKALEREVQMAAEREREGGEKQRAAEAALDSVQQQMAELCRSETLSRARQQHDRDVATMREQHEARALALQRRLDAQTQALQEQEEAGRRLREQLTQLERQREEEKLERAVVVNTLTQRLEESQQQCASLLQTGSIQEMNQLRIQLQQAQSAKSISESMSKSVQEELCELKEQVTLYESAVKLGVISLDSNGEWENHLSDSYVELGIKKVNWKCNPCHSGSVAAAAVPVVSDALSRHDMLPELKAELQRLLASLKTKRQKISELQRELQEAQGQVQELQAQLDTAKKRAWDSRVRETTLEKQLEASEATAGQEDIQQLQQQKVQLQDCVEKLEKQNRELKQSEEKVRAANLELCTKMREMIQELDQEKQETAARYERTQQQFRDDVVSRVRVEMAQEHAAQMDELRGQCQRQVQDLESRLADVNKEMAVVQECYISVCREKGALEDTLRVRMEEELKKRENELRSQLEQEKECALAQQEAQHHAARELWVKEREAEVSVGKSTWEGQHSKVTQAAVEQVEKDWTQRLKQVARERRSEVGERATQTEGAETAFTRAELDGQLAAQKHVLQEAADQAQARAVKEVEERMQGELHNKLLEAVSQQVESALSEAHKRWLQEMPSLPEYQAKLQALREEWEKQQEAQKVCAEAEQGCRERAELQEEVRLLHRQLEQDREEQAARLKAELAQARAAWNRDKQEEIARLQDRNEGDYRSLLEEQRTKLEEALSLAKVEAERLRMEAVRRKEADFQHLLREREEEWRVQFESQSHAKRERNQQEALAEVQAALEEIQDLLTRNPKWVVQSEKALPSKLQGSVSGDGAGRLRDCVQTTCLALLHQAAAQAQQHWKEVNEDKPDCMLMEPCDNREREVNQIGTLAAQARQQPCGQSCRDEVRVLQKQCHSLQRHLQKACRQLQNSVRDSSAALQRLKEEHEEALQKEREESMKRLEEMRKPLSTRSPPNQNGGSSPERQQSLQALEEMRQQYMKAVGKIRGDMLRYIQESKGRAAEMIRTEVLRERQSTARRMRQYYLACLQELLEDGGKAQGAEKKILNAASKLAAMAKVLETPVPKKHNGRGHTALTSMLKSETAAGEKPASSSPVCTEQSPPARDVALLNSKPGEQNCPGLPFAESHSRPAAEHVGTEADKQGVQTSGTKPPPPQGSVTCGKRKMSEDAQPKTSPIPTCYLPCAFVEQPKCPPSASQAGDGPQAHVTLRSINRGMCSGRSASSHTKDIPAAKPTVKALLTREVPVREGGQRNWSLAKAGPNVEHQRPTPSCSDGRVEQISVFPSLPPAFMSSPETEGTSGSLSSFESWGTYRDIPKVMSRDKVKPSPAPGVEVTKAREPTPGSEGERLRKVCSKSLFSQVKACQQDSGFESPLSLLHK